MHANAPAPAPEPAPATLRCAFDTAEEPCERTPVHLITADPPNTAQPPQPSTDPKYVGPFSMRVCNSCFFDATDTLRDSGMINIRCTVPELQGKYSAWRG